MGIGVDKLSDLFGDPTPAIDEVTLGFCLS
jgi:hypothetical protein